MVFDICQGLWKSDLWPNGSFDYITDKVYFNSKILWSKLKKKLSRAMYVYLTKNQWSFKDEQRCDLSVCYFSFN